jgi:hypothetical protein
MLKWKILAAVGLAFGVAGLAWGFAQQRNAPGFFELRVYTALPGKRDALAKRFADRTAAIYARHGITNVGYFIPQQSDPELGISGRTPSRKGGDSIADIADPSVHGRHPVWEFRPA